MQRGQSGEYHITVAGSERVRAFIPAALPPVPPLVIDAPLASALVEAGIALGRLDSLDLMPETNLFLYQYIRKEAVLSSRIEGTQSTLDDLLAFEDEDVPGVPLDDVAEVSNYVAAMEHGQRRLGEGFPLSARLLREVHAVLLRSGRGQGKEPGEFKRTQNWIGGTRPGNAAFVPTPPHETGRCIGELEQFIHAQEGLHVLLRAGLAHVQFETIHPFLDGNGRIGRMLVTLMLLDAGVLKAPTLYLSLFLKTFREEYYRLLQLVREHGAWEEWLAFFLEGVRLTAMDAVQAAERVKAVYQADRERIRASRKATLAVLSTHDAMLTRQMASPKRLVSLTGLTLPTVLSALRSLQDLGIVQETTGRQRNTRYAYKATARILADEVGSFGSLQTEEGSS